MLSSRSNRPQNLHPDALLQERKDAASRNEEAVRVAVQAMQLRKTDPQKITVRTVARESGVSEATIYRRDALFALVRKANPRLQRRHIVLAREQDRARLENELADGKRESESHKRVAEIAKIESRRLLVQNDKLRKRIVDLERENERLTRQIASCTCQNKQWPFSVQSEVNP